MLPPPSWHNNFFMIEIFLITNAIITIEPVLIKRPEQFDKLRQTAAHLHPSPADGQPANFSKIYEKFIFIPRYPQLYRLQKGLEYAKIIPYVQKEKRGA